MERAVSSALFYLFQLMMNKLPMPKILLVEDNEDNAYLIRTLVSRENVELIEATTGLQAVELAISERPNLVLMDIQLPDINGYEAAIRIREALGDSVRILAVTAYAMAGDREKCLEAGCDGYVEKPININNFLQEIASYL